ncbi:MAG: GGDEF domain-containing protein, partial [Bradyrhizobium sp.]
AGVPLRSANGVCVGTLCAMDTEPRAFDEKEVAVLLDLARMVETELELRILATTDSLTGVVARHAFLDEGARAVSLALRHRYDLSCIAFDLDHFKTINDTAGHVAGDAVLAATAQTCAALLRKSDIFGRLGGEEFSIILPHTGAANAAKVAEKLRARIEAQTTKSELPHAVTASFGVAALASAPTDLAELLASADRARHEAKARGRNCCVTAVKRPPEAAQLGRRVLKAGSIVFNRGNSVIDCTVRRLSETGAKLDVIASGEIPRRFKLSIELDGFSRACTVARKDEQSLEVVFDQF